MATNQFSLLQISAGNAVNTSKNSVLKGGSEGGDGPGRQSSSFKTLIQDAVANGNRLPSEESADDSPSIDPRTGLLLDANSEALLSDVADPSFVPSETSETAKKRLNRPIRWPLGLINCRVHASVA